MAKFIRFKDGAADQHAYSVDNIKGAYITAATTVVFYVSPIDIADNSSSNVTLTVTSGKAQEVLDEILKAAVKIDTAVYEVSASHADITTVAFTEGA